MDTNTCYELTKNVQTISLYTHYVPIIISFILAVYLLKKTNFSLLSRIFFCFILSINFWLFSDVVAWTIPNYNIIHSFWSFFDYTNIIFFIFGLYFFVVFVKQRDIDWQWKIFGFATTLPVLYLILAGKSVMYFDQTVCESINNDLLSIYKNFIEGFVVLGILFFTGKTILVEKDRNIRNRIISVSSGLLLFFITFAGADYLSVKTGIYEIGLYGLFIMPIFLGLIVYAIVKYKAFDVGVLAAQALVVTLALLVGTQFFFIQSTTNFILNCITFILAIVFGYFLVRGIKRDGESRLQLEKFSTDLKHSNEMLINANNRLKNLDQQKTEFISLATHQIRGPLGAIKGHASLALEGDYGPINEGSKKAFETIMHSAQGLVVVVNDYLDVSRIEQGRMKYDFSEFDLKDLTKETVSDFLPTITNKKLTMDFNCDQFSKYMIYADKGKIKQVIGNLIDNSIKYTPSGHIRMSLEKKWGKTGKSVVLLSIKDTGVGIKAEILPNLFTKFSRAPDANKRNILGTGLGLFVARKMVEAHDGIIWAESYGLGKGSQFYVELEEKK